MGFQWTTALLDHCSVLVKKVFSFFSGREVFLSARDQVKVRAVQQRRKVGIFGLKSQVGEVSQRYEILVVSAADHT